ncbi:hypothetical protein CLAFUW4_10936 [Fulvia fulva]|uniref:Uncharacterized protein n=1 Tax=Passalora fulva TaxID=5499 RepID=A0A9Q8PD78_PASFU|nr:uncharacterized protein CLAFUR5_09978 [Fulvia fulva]KAK4620199.1 hypothetical protein CLAFUR4_10941 [Fulvia fulva]KAK4620440.1 hypothetical protein CLAFUR0_10948 [Fulvia fulva]UJO20391.1 hypothetical protein CLAFUR5_09978 [Fulvia fulva]WPV17397.1 hypothetical protein CLAFUW4_10936 [Fulvia fulva]WPV32444.1 hypothetical protein CLAFUW7_10934 [Fulvia fulva]
MPFSLPDLSKDNISMYTIPVIWLGSVLPRFWAGSYYSSKTQGKGMMDVRAPRTWHAQIDADSRLDARTKGRLQRAEAAVANNIEQVGPYAAAIVAGTVAGLSPTMLNGTAFGFLAIRIV